MKFASVITILPAAVFAGKADIAMQVEALAANVSVSERNLIPILGPQLSHIDGYGCWCYFDGQYTKGRGQPASLVDAACQQLQHGYKCAILDGEEESDECTPWEVSYLSASQYGESLLVSKCDELNPGNNCASRACKIEGYFVIAMFQAFFDPESNHSPALLHENGFDPKVECPTKTGVKSEYKCCGYYPYTIRPYKTYDGKRACCNGKTYDAEIYECCADGSRQISCPL
jgi:hypothetical protein